MAVTPAAFRGIRVADLDDALDVPALVDGRDSIFTAFAELDGRAQRVLLTYHEGKPFTLTRADLDLVLPSPASGLDRHEIPELLRRITVRQALGEPARVATSSDSVASAVRRMRDGAWRPLVVVDRDELRGVLTVEGLLSSLVLREGAVLPLPLVSRPPRPREPWFHTVLPPTYPGHVLPYVVDADRRRESIARTVAWATTRRAAGDGDAVSVTRRIAAALAGVFRR